jgi:hypothetical protein
MTGSKKRHFTPLNYVSLEVLVPQDYFYRHLERTLDLSCVREIACLALEKWSLLMSIGSACSLVWTLSVSLSASSLNIRLVVEPCF